MRSPDFRARAVSGQVEQIGVEFSGDSARWARAPPGALLDVEHAGRPAIAPGPSIRTGALGGASGRTNARGPTRTAPYETSTRRPPAISTAAVPAPRPQAIHHRRHPPRQRGPLDRRAAGVARRPHRACRRRQRHQRLPDARILLGQRRQVAVADPCAREAQVGVGRIVDEGDAASTEVAEDLRAGQVEQRTHEGIPSVRNPLQTCQPGSAHDAEKDRLGLVVGLVPERHPARAALGRQHRQRAEPRPARGILQTSASPVAGDVDG